MRCGRIFPRHFELITHSQISFLEEHYHNPQANPHALDDQQ